MLATYAWDADRVRADRQTSVVEHLGAADGVLVVDETGFLKKGTKAVGVKRQYSGTAGRIANCQSGVLLAYARPRGRAFLDRELDLPPEWVADRQRRKEAGVPETGEFPTKPHLARAMLERAGAVQVPFRWVTGDAVDGGERRLRLWLAEHDLAHVLAVKSTAPLGALTTEGPVQVSAAALAAGVRDEAWRQLSAGDGAKGPRLDDGARGRVRPFSDPERGYWLLVRRSLSDPTDRASSVCFGPQDTTLADLVRIAGVRWTIAACLEAAKGEVGLDHDAVRRWVGWYRHVTLALLAHAYLAVTRRHAQADAEKGAA